MTKSPNEDVIIMKQKFDIVKVSQKLKCNFCHNFHWYDYNLVSHNVCFVIIWTFPNHDLICVQTCFFVLWCAADLAGLLTMRRPFLLRWPSAACKDLSRSSNDMILKLICRDIYTIYLSQDQALHAGQTEAPGSVRVPSEWRDEGIPLQRPSHTGPDRGPPAGLGPPAGPGAQGCGNVCEEAGRNTSADHRLCGVIQSNSKPPRRKRQVTEPEEPGFEEISVLRWDTDSVL